MARILVVDDDVAIQEMLGYILRREGYTVEEALTGEDALRLAQRVPLDLVILDLMLPGIDGFAVCQRLRVARTMPVLMLTGQAGEADKVRGLDTGADDYLTKPFSPAELLARVRALLRRSSPLTAPPTTPFEVGGIRIDLGRGRLSLNEKDVPVSRSELAMLACLAIHAGEPVPPRALVKQALNYDCDDTQARAILKVRVSRLRAKLGDDSSRPRILTNVRGIGYALCPPGLEVA